MKPRDTLLLSRTDFDELMYLTKIAAPTVAASLEDEISRAQVLPDAELPDDVVCMNASVAFRDLDTKEERTVTLVFPYDADIKEQRISVLSPVGSALIGLRVGQQIRWPVPSGKQRRLQVLNVRRGRR